MLDCVKVVFRLCHVVPLFWDVRYLAKGRKGRHDDPSLGEARWGKLQKEKRIGDSLFQHFSRTRKQHCFTTEKHRQGTSQNERDDEVIQKV